MKPLNVIKIGGNVIDDPENLMNFLSDFSALKGDKILIHGGGKIATKLSTDLGIKSKLIEGRRVTDGETLKIVTMVYSGLINKNIIAALQNKQCNAIGLTGADGNFIRAKKRQPVKVYSEEKGATLLASHIQAQGWKDISIKNEGWSHLANKIPSWIFILFTIFITIMAVRNKLSLIPILGLLSCLYMMSQLALANWIYFTIWLLLGLVIYFLYGRKHSKLAGC